MKKIVLIALPALALIASCSKTEVTPAQTDPQQISFFTLVNRQGTKADPTADTIIDGAVYPINETFGTFAYFNAQNTTFPTGAELLIPNSEVKNSTKGAKTGTVWTTDPAYYWPKQGTLAFYSYSPWDELNTITECDTKDGITIGTDTKPWDVSANQTVDVMVADLISGQNKNIEPDATGATTVVNPSTYTGVPTIFRHKLAQIVKFTFKTDKDYLGTGTKAGDKKFYINSIAINNIDYSGVYVSGKNVSKTSLGEWTVKNTDGKNYVWFNQDTNDDTNIFGSTGTVVNANKLDANSSSYILVLPQDFAEPTGEVSAAKNIQITYTISTYNGKGWVNETVKDVYASLWAVQGGKAANGSPAAVKASSWEMNKKYSYTITIGLDQIYWAPSVVDWEEADAFEYTMPNA